MKRCTFATPIIRFSWIFHSCYTSPISGVQIAVPIFIFIFKYRYCENAAEIDATLIIAPTVAIFVQPLPLLARVQGELETLLVSRTKKTMIVDVVFVNSVNSVIGAEGWEKGES